jgi:hypothetical protein
MTPAAAGGPTAVSRVQPSRKLLQDSRNDRGDQMTRHDEPSIRTVPIGIDASGTRCETDSMGAIDVRLTGTGERKRSRR